MASIANSKTGLTAVAKEKDGTAYIPADSVVIKNPKTQSSIAYLHTDKLTVGNSSSSSVNLSVRNLVLSGASGSSVVYEGYYPNFVHSGAEELTINGGTFTVYGTTSDNGFGEINNLLGMVGNSGNIIINSRPKAIGSDGWEVIELPTSFTFSDLSSSSAKATLNFNYNYLDSGIVVGGWKANSAETGLYFGKGLAVNGNFLVKLGVTLTTNKDLNTDTVNHVYKLKSDNKYTNSISEVNSETNYVYGVLVDITFHSTDPVFKVEKTFNYNTAITLPTAEDMGILKDKYEVDYWTASSISTEKLYDNGVSNVKFTEDMEYMPTGKKSIVLSNAVTVDSGKAIISNIPIYVYSSSTCDGDPIVDVSTENNSVKDWVYYYLNNTGATVYVKGYYVDGQEIDGIESYNIVQEDILDDYNDGTTDYIENRIGNAVVKEIAIFNSTDRYYIGHGNSSYPYKMFLCTNPAEGIWEWQSISDKPSGKTVRWEYESFTFE